MVFGPEVDSILTYGPGPIPGGGSGGGANGGQSTTFLQCVKLGTDHFNLQTGLQAVSGGKLGNGAVSEALLGSSVSSVINFFDGHPGDAVGEGVGKSLPSAAEGASSLVPDVAFVTTTQTTVAVRGRGFAGGVALIERATRFIPTGAIARAGARVFAGVARGLDAVKDPVDLAVGAFSGLVCSITR